MVAHDRDEREKGTGPVAKVASDKTEAKTDSAQCAHDARAILLNV